MKFLKFLIPAGAFLMLAMVVNGSGPSAEEIIQKVDAHNFIANNFEMTIRVETYRQNKLQRPTVMKGSINHGEMTQLIFLEPVNMKDRKIVIKDDDMWIVIPKVKNPIHVTPSQRLVGGISYSDFAKIRYATDYIPKLIGEEQVAGLNPDGGNSPAVACYSLELSAKELKQGYSKIMIWVEQQDFLPVKADFYVPSGKKMMTAYYTAPKLWDGKMIISKMFLFDQINLAKHFSVEYSDIRISDGAQN